MECEQCEERAVISKPARCVTHFIESFETRVWDTIDRFTLIKDGERICVAASGGKDSLALLYVLKQRYDVEALCVDEGIPGYRDNTIEDLKHFCKKHDISLRVVSFEDLGAKPLHEQNPSHPCSACGVLRRKALMQYSTEYDLLATGHNLDDECQSILMNLLRNQPQLLARLGPRTPASEKIAARIKPFYVTPEREIRAYCIVQGIDVSFTECPNVVKSFRWKVGEELNALEEKQPGSKKNIIEHFLSQTYQDTAHKGTCSKCGMPSAQELCRACKLIVIQA